MVGHFMLLKMLHCKFQSKRKFCNSEHNEHRKIKEEKSEEFPSTCRVCLKHGDIVIFGNPDLTEALAMFGGIEISVDDKYPKHLCESCYSLLQGAILFRKTAQQTNDILNQQTDHSENDFSFSDDCYEGSEPKPKSFYCKKCNLNFDNFTEFSDHRLTQEHENMRQTCPICKNSYTTLYYKKHLALHKLETPYICDICGKKFIIQGQFTRHRVTHFHDLPFKCSLCPYRGRFSESVKMHMRSHTGEKPYQCTQCPARFVNKSNLNRHMFTHQVGHDYKCASCGRGFYTKRDLDVHFKVDHTGIKDHVCNICGKAFGYRKQMMKHQLKVHKRQKQKSGRMPLYLQLENK